jgi:hypothetical protein
MLQYGQLPLQNENILLKHAVRFGHLDFQFCAGQFDGLNQALTLSRLKANKNFQPNLGSGQT